ncbi:hypothetical protein NOVOSPHI9U_350003 [Novosphingobium sp. 9U]|nr:hypothetical protein NOVOSPHI9U_350003 [Novosphingobium sp. 9U]
MKWFRTTTMELCREWYGEPQTVSKPELSTTAWRFYAQQEEQFGRGVPLLGRVDATYKSGRRG